MKSPSCERCCRCSHGHAAPQGFGLLPFRCLLLFFLLFLLLLSLCCFLSSFLSSFPSSFISSYFFFISSPPSSPSSLYLSLPSSLSSSVSSFLSLSLCHFLTLSKQPAAFTPHMRTPFPHPISDTPLGQRPTPCSLRVLIWPGFRFLLASSHVSAPALALPRPLPHLALRCRTCVRVRNRKTSHMCERESAVD